MIRITALEEAHLPRVQEFLQRVYPQAPDKADPAYFRWRFLDGPYGSSAEAYTLAWDGDRVIGQVGALRDRLVAVDHREEVTWLVDMIVEPEHRGSLLPVRLVRRAQASSNTILLSGTNPAVVKLYTALGFARRVGNRTLYLPHRTAHVLGARAPAWLLSIADTALSTINPHALLPLLIADAGVSSIISVTPEDARLRSLLACAAGPRIEVEASAEVLSFRAARPRGRHRIDLALGRDGEPLGFLFAKWFRRLSGARWVDIVHYGGPMPVIRKLVAALAGGLAKDRVDFLRMRGPETLAHAMRPLLFMDRMRASVDEIFVWSRQPDIVQWLMSAPMNIGGLAADRADHGSDEW